MNEIIAYLVGTLITILFTRWVFGINQILKAHKASIGLLIILAKKSGATSQEIDEILDKVYPK